MISKHCLLLFCFCPVQIVSTHSATQRLPLSFSNPVLGPDHPDPSVLHFNDTYYLTYTPGDRDAALFRSADLQSWELATAGIFNATAPATSGHSVQLVSGEPFWYCDIWSPVLTHIGRGTRAPFMASFSARRFSTPQHPCRPLPVHGDCVPGIRVSTDRSLPLRRARRSRGQLFGRFIPRGTAITG